MGLEHESRSKRLYGRELKLVTSLELLELYSLDLYEEVDSRLEMLRSDCFLL